MKKKSIYYWKCQDCGLTYQKFTSGEPHWGCPSCGKRGVKIYIKTNHIFVNKRTLTQKKGMRKEAFYGKVVKEPWQAVVE